MTVASGAGDSVVAASSAATAARSGGCGGVGRVKEDGGTLGCGLAGQDKEGAAAATTTGSAILVTTNRPFFFTVGTGGAAVAGAAAIAISVAAAAGSLVSGGDVPGSATAGGNEGVCCPNRVNLPLRLGAVAAADTSGTLSGVEPSDDPTAALFVSGALLLAAPSGSVEASAASILRTAAATTASYTLI
jgi:hypothetical protein